MIKCGHKTNMHCNFTKLKCHKTNVLVIKQNNMHCNLTKLKCHKANIHCNFTKL